jgi:hydroxysqualene synthase
VGIGHYENFPVASVLCPPTLRVPIRAIYAFARTADDIADEGDDPPQLRLAKLARYRSELLAAAASNAASHAAAAWPEVFGPLAKAMHAFALPMPLLESLLDAFEQDVRAPVYDSRDQLLDYCRRSANPIGRLVLHLYGIHDQASLQQSDAICTALQLINFWQDLSLDWPRGRIYVPRTDASRHGVDLAHGWRAASDTALRALVRELVHWAAATLASGAALPRRVPGRAGWELRLVVHGGWRILERIAAMQYEAWIRRPRLTFRDTPTLIWRSLHLSAQQFSTASLR